MIDVRIRLASIDDADELVAMHGRCSVDTIYRRYHTPTPRLSQRLAQVIACPRAGWSLVATVDDEIVGIAMVSKVGPRAAEFGILVEDRWQRRGLGLRLIRGTARRAADDGLATLAGVVQRDNAALPALVRRAGLVARLACADGAFRLTIPIDYVAAARQERRENKLEPGSVTTGLVDLLHRRHDLRGISGPGDLIDCTVREGA